MGEVGERGRKEEVEVELELGDNLSGEDDREEECEVSGVALDDEEGVDDPGEEAAVTKCWDVHQHFVDSDRTLLKGSV